MRLKLLLSVIICIFVSATAAFARNGGIEITDSNSTNIIEISNSLACLFRPQKAFSIAGTIQTRGDSQYFIPRKQVINRKLKRMRSRGRSGAFVKRRKQKLVKAMKKLRTRCDNYRLIGRAVEAVIASAADPDGELNDYIDLMLNIFSGTSSTSTEYLEDLATLLSVFKEKEDFDSLVDIHTNAESIRELVDTSASAVNVSAVECNESSTHVYFVPGVDTDIFTTFMQAAMLREQLQQTVPTLAADISFRVWFTKEGLPPATGEVCRLFLGPAASAIPMIDNDASIALLPNAMQDVAKAYNQAFENCLDAYNVSADSIQSLSDWQTAAGAYAPDVGEVSDLSEQVQLDITSGRKVILVGHAQGNELVKDLVDGLTSDGDGNFEDDAAVIAISPISKFTNSDNYGGFEYFLLDGDLGEAETSYTPNESNDLSSDINITQETHRFAQHELGLSYLRDSTIASEISNAIKNLADGITNDRDFIGQGYFQVSLSWDIDGDIDLHVFEPNGEHVLWSDKQGIVGQLDRDDIPGDGPENYFVCEKSSMETGTFTVKVNNYGGVVGTLATITVRGLFDTETYTVTMDAANGGATLLDVVEVEYDSDGNFTFTDIR